MGVGSEYDAGIRVGAEGFYMEWIEIVIHHRRASLMVWIGQGKFEFFFFFIGKPCIIIQEDFSVISLFEILATCLSPSTTGSGHDL